VPLVIVDEVGYIPFDPDAAALFFALISSRYERASLIVSSNKTFFKAHRFRRTCARWCLMGTGWSLVVVEAAWIDVVGEVVDETGGLHAEGLAGDLGVESDDQVGDSGGSELFRGHTDRVENVGQIGGRGRRGSGLGLIGDDEMRFRVFRALRWTRQASMAVTLKGSRTIRGRRPTLRLWADGL
jgi:hypothetical protein